MRFVDWIAFRDEGEFNEADHPRDEDGKFAASQPSFNKDKYKALMGPEFKGVARSAAVRKLLKEQRGHVKDAFYRKEIGGIDLLWGNEDIGLAHIVRRRRDTCPELDVDAFVDDMATIIEDGAIYYNRETNNFEIWHNKKLVIITKQFFGHDIRLVITECPSRKMPKRFKA